MEFPYIRATSLSPKGKNFILTHFLFFQGILGLPSWSWLSLYISSLLSPRYSSIFKAFSMILRRKKTPMNGFSASTRSFYFSRYFIHSLGLKILPLRMKGVAFGDSSLKLRQVVYLTSKLFCLSFIQNLPVILLSFLQILFWLTDFLLPKCCHDLLYQVCQQK